MISYSGGTPFGGQQMPQSVGPTQVQQQGLPMGGGMANPNPVLNQQNIAMMAQALKQYQSNNPAGPNTGLADQMATQTANSMGAQPVAPITSQ